MHKRLAVHFAMGLPLYLLAFTSAVWAQDAKQDDAGLLGSWQMQVTPTSASSCGGVAVPAPPPFAELVTFNAGGGFQETNSQLNWHVGPLFPGLFASASDGFGTWAKRQSQTYVKFRKLLFDSSGTYIANVDVRINLDKAQHDRIAGKFTIQFNFLDGSPSVCGAGDVGGVPIRPED